MIPTATLDALILRIIEAVDAPEVEWESDVLLRAGATKGRRASVEDVARRIEMHPSSLARLFQGVESPGPQTLLAWGRLIAAMHAWDWREDLELLANARMNQPRLVSLGRVAITQGWGSHYVLARALNRHAGLNPTTWARRGGSLEDLVDLFLARWRVRGTRGRRERMVAA